MKRFGEYDFIITYQEQEFVGDCTVWNYYPSGRRADTMLESTLSEIWQREKWKIEKQEGKENE